MTDIKGMKGKDGMAEYSLGPTWMQPGLWARSLEVLLDPCSSIL